MRRRTGSTRQAGAWRLQGGDIGSMPSVHIVSTNCKAARGPSIGRSLTRRRGVGDTTVARGWAWLRGRPLTDFGRRRPNLPLPSERVKSAAPLGRCRPCAGAGAWTENRKTPQPRIRSPGSRPGQAGAGSARSLNGEGTNGADRSECQGVAVLRGVGARLGMCSVGRGDVFSFWPDVFSFRANVFSFLAGCVHFRGKCVQFLSECVHFGGGKCPGFGGGRWLRIGDGRKARFLGSAALRSE